jgi:hydrogenase maturation protease
VKNALIGGVGNVLLGDDATGPYVVRLLEASYAFGNDVEILDLGTPALDLTHRIVGLDTLVLVDSVCSDVPPGIVVLYRKKDIVDAMPAQRLDPHSPALSECLMIAEMLGAAPQHVLLVGIVGECYEPGRSLSPAVAESIQPAMQAVVSEMERLGYEFQKKLSPGEPGIWWSDFAASYPCTTDTQE